MRPPRRTAAARLAQAIMSAVGTTVWVEHESQLDTVTALSGSGPAYFFLLMEALEAAAHARGLPADVAHELTLQTALGAAQMARHSATARHAARAGNVQGRHHRRGAGGLRCRRTA
jgi:pyrroline-5-carboxylate reductase